MKSFSLLTEPWIGVINRDHAEEKVSLLELFEKAHLWRSVTDSNPLVVASIYRLALVILYRALKPKADSDDWMELYRAGSFSVAVQNYLQHVEDRFDLFSEQHPFFQTAALTKDSPTSVKKLSPDFATANNKTLFSHYADDDDVALAPADAAKYLLVCQYFSLGGGNSGGSSLAKKHPNYTHAPLIGGALTYLTGANLFETLLFNLKPLKAVDTSAEDKPVWENDDLNGTGELEPFGLLSYMTFKCRHIRLLPNEQGYSATMYMTQGYSLPNESAYRQTEPAFAYRMNNKQERKTIPVSFARSFWRDSKSIYQRITLESHETMELRPACFRHMADLLFYDDIKRVQVGCFVTGLENSKANPLHWLNEFLPVNVQLLTESEASDYFAQAIERSEEMAVRIYYALQTYAEYILPSNPRKEDINKVVEGIDNRANYWTELGYHYPHLVENITNDEVGTYQHWIEICFNAAKKNLEQTLDNQLGRTAKELKARSLAQHKLNISLAAFKKEFSNAE